MARPKKYGLDYFPLDVDIFEDDKLFDVQNEYGSTGEAVYLRLLCLVYKNGYYFRFDSLDKLALLILRSIGNRWADKEKIKEIILYLGECGLFSAELLRAGVVTSRSIQRRFLKAKERSCPVIGEYCLIPREPVPDEDNPAPEEQAAAVKVNPAPVEHAAAQVSPAPVEHAAAAGQVSITPMEQEAAAPDMQAGVIAAETGVIAAETVVNVCNNPTKKSKEKQSKEKESTAEHSEAKQTKEKESTAEQSEAKQIKEKAAEEESKERASADPRTQLVSKYGSRAVEDYERRYRGWQQKNGIIGGNMYNVISKWMAQDGVEADNAPHSFDSDEVMSEIMRKYMQQL